MISYQCNEGSFPLPSDEWQDRSMNIFHHPDNRFMLMVTRSTIPDGKTLKEELEHQWEMLKNAVTLKTFEPRIKVSLIKHPDVEAYQTECCYTQKGQTVFQRQLTVELNEKNMMIFTQTAGNEFSQEDTEYWQKISSQLTLSK